MRRQISILLADLGLIVVATLCAGAIRDNLEISLERTYQLLPYTGWTVVSGAVVLLAMGMSRSIWRFNSLADYARVVLAVIAIVLGAVALCFLANRLDNIARALPVMQGILMVCALVGARVAFRVYHTYRRQVRSKPTAASSEGRGEAVLVVGLNRITELYLMSVAEFANGRIDVVGLLGRSERHTGSLMLNLPVLGVPEDIASIVNELDVRGIVVERIVVTTAFDRLSAAAQDALLEIERNSNVKLDFFGERLLLDERQRLSGPHDTAKNESVAAFVVDDETVQGLTTRPYWKVKRALDFGLAVCLLAVAVPAFVVVGILVAVDVGWPVTFWQVRPGRMGESFKLFKFRTMAAAYDRAGNRITDSERLSGIGRLLRRTRFDELPQLLHILSGDMSFVGPRPLLPIDQSPAFAARLLVRPGLTGWAQVKGGREITAVDKAALDVWYVKKASLRLDLSILAGTVPMVLRGEQVDRGAIRSAWRDLVEQGVCAASSLPVEYRQTEADGLA